MSEPTVRRQLEEALEDVEAALKRMGVRLNAMDAVSEDDVPYFSVFDKVELALARARAEPEEA